MKGLIFFINVGPYHNARIKSLKESCLTNSIHLDAAQLTDNTLEHPWGVFDKTSIYTLQSKIKRTDLFKQPRVDKKEVFEFLDRINPDFIFVPGWTFKACRLIIRWGKANNKKIFLMSESKHNDKPRIPFLEYIKGIIINWAFSGAIVGGDAHKKYLLSLGFKKPIVLGYDVVDDGVFNPRYKKGKSYENKHILFLKNKSTQDYFLFVSRLMPRKNIFRLLKAYKNYLNSCQNSKYDLVICGNGNQLEKAINLTKRLGISDNVHFKGFVTYQEIIEYMSNAKALIHPAISEQWGLVINEACHSALPILSSDTVGASDELVIENHNGFLFNPKSINSISQVMMKFSSLNEEDVLKFGEQSFNLVSSKYPTEIFGKNALQLLKLSI